MFFPKNGGLSPKHVGEDTASLYTYTYAYTHTHTHIYIYIFIYIYIYIYLYIYIVYALVSCVIRNSS